MTFTEDANAATTALLAHEDDLLRDELIPEFEEPTDVLLALAIALRGWAESYDEGVNAWLRSKGETVQTMAEMWAESLLETEQEAEG